MAFNLIVSGVSGKPMLVEVSGNFAELQPYLERALPVQFFCTFGIELYLYIHS